MNNIMQHFTLWFFLARLDLQKSIENIKDHVYSQNLFNNFTSLNEVMTIQGV